MNTYHSRVVVLHYSNDSLPKHASNEEVDEWHRALGRLVAYDLTSKPETDTEQLSSILIRKDEMTAVHYRRKEQYMQHKVEDLATPQSFTLGAVLRPEGKYTFHS